MRLHIEELQHEENEVFSWQLQDAQDYQAQKGGTLGKALVNLGFVKGEEVAGLLARRVRPPVDRPRPPHGRSRHHRARPRGDGEDLQGPAALALRCDADRRHGRPDERAGDGRHQAHDRLQRRAGRGVRVGARGRDRRLLRPDAARPVAAGHRARRGLREDRANGLAVRDRDARGRGGECPPPHPRHRRGRGGHAGSAHPGARRGASSRSGAGSPARRSYGPAAQARPSAIGPAGISRSTFHSARSISATWPLASQDT